MSGRPNKYDTHVKPRFDEISVWCQNGATDEEIWTNLGIVKSTFISYKNKYLDFSNLIKNNRKKPVEEIKAAMLKRAKGFQYEEKKVITRFIELPDEIKKVLDENNIHFETHPKLVKTEITTKTALPDVAAGLVLLQHWDKDDKGKTKWSRDPAQLEFKKEELELKKEKIENENW